MSLPNKEERSPLDSIEHELYNPKAIEAGTEIHTVPSRRTVDLPTSWGEESPIITKTKEETGFSFGAKFLLIATCILLAALLFSGWRVFSLRNVVSATNIDMTADITPFVEGGEETPLILTLRNRNVADLEDASVTLLYKQGNGALDEQEKVQDKRDLGLIRTNEYKKQDFKIVVYGSESEKRDLVLKLEYKVKGSNATFSKLVTASIVLKTPPISVNVKGPETLSVGQSGTYDFTITNNSATTSLPSLLQLTLPNSFSLESSSEKAVPRSTSWVIPALPSGKSTTISVTGSFEGKQGEFGTIQAKIGSRGDNPSAIGIVYASSVMDVTLRSSPLTLGMTLTSDSSVGEAIKYGDRVTLTITYVNTSNQALEDVVLTLSLLGEAALYNAINPVEGYYDSVRKTITWDKATFPDLAVLAPNSQGTLQVVVPIVQKGNNSPTLKATIVGVAQAKSKDDITATFAKTWGVQGSAAVMASTQYKNSSFQNSGPVPPEANQETTYTVNLRVVAQNALINTRVSFTLPAYVTWRGVTSDQNLVTYDARTRTVSWNIGKLGQGGSTAVDIGVTVKPSKSHVGQSPAITSGIILDADEEVSRAHLRTTLSPLTTSVKGESWPTNPALVVDR